jgi:hypothetical protein
MMQKFLCANVVVAKCVSVPPIAKMHTRPWYNLAAESTTKSAPMNIFSTTHRTSFSQIFCCKLQLLVTCYAAAAAAWKINALFSKLRVAG